MAWQLVEEVLDHAPASVGGSDLLLLIIVAERAPVTTREAWQGEQWDLSTILRRMRMTNTGLVRVFQRLSKAGCEVRKPLKVDKKGRPVYAWEGVSVTFLLPRFVDGQVIENLNYPSGHPMRVELLPAWGTTPGLETGGTPGLETTPPLAWKPPQQAQKEPEAPQPRGLEEPEDSEGGQKYTLSGSEGGQLSREGGQKYTLSGSEDVRQYTLLRTEVHPLERERVYRSTPHIRSPDLDPSSLRAREDEPGGSVVCLEERREEKSALRKINHTPVELVSPLLAEGEDPEQFVAVIVGEQFQGVRHPVAFFGKLHDNGDLVSWVEKARKLIRDANLRVAAIEAEVAASAERNRQRADHYAAQAAGATRNGAARHRCPQCNRIGFADGRCTFADCGHVAISVS